MSIGLYDEDMVKYKQVPFNLELMKLSAYYKKKREIVILSPSFIPEKYSKFFIRKDYYDGHFMEIPFTEQIEFGGLAYTKNKYHPLDLSIERMVPDIQIYSNFQKNFDDTTQHKKNFRAMLTAAHLRLSLDGENIWSDFKKQMYPTEKQINFFFHDYDLGAIRGAADLIDNLTTITQHTKNPVKIGSKFPIQTSSQEDIVKWTTFFGMENLYTVQFNGILEDETVIKLLRRAATKQVLNQLEYNVTGGRYETNEFFISRLPQIFKQVIFSRSNHQRFHLIYDENFFVDKRWIDVLDLINAYGATVINLRDFVFNKLVEVDSMFKFCSRMDEVSRFARHTINKQKAREIFLFVKEKSPELFDLFYNCSVVGIRGGNFTNETVRNTKTNR